MHYPSFAGLVVTCFLLRQSCDEYINLSLPDAR